MKEQIATMLAAASVIASWAYSVKMKCVDADGESAAFATYRIFPDSTDVAAAVGVADSAGVFRAELPRAGKYRIQITEAGMSRPSLHTVILNDSLPDADMGTVEVGDTAENLAEVVVTAQKPLVVKQIDRIAYDIQADPASKVSSVQEMLRRVPMVAVDNEGNVTVNGSSNFKIFKNNRPSNSLSNNAKDILAAIPASTIKSIEVITEPGAKYDAEGIGAILNIITLDNSSIKGVLGNVGVSANTQGSTSANAFITTQIDKVTLSINGGVHNQPRHDSDQESVDLRHYNNGNTLTTNQWSDYKALVGFFGMEGSYEISKKHLLTAEMDGYVFNVDNRSKTSSAMTDAAGNALYSYNSSNTTPTQKQLSMSGNLNYQFTTDRPGETLTAGYMISANNSRNHSLTEYSDITGDAFPYTGIDSHVKQNLTEHTFQVDWVRPFGKIHTLELGAKYVLRRNTSDNNIDYTGWQTVDNAFRHITDIGAAYAQYTARVRKVTLRGGVRYEYSRLKAEYPDGNGKDFASNLNDVVPSASMSWQINDANSLQFNYATRINRPGIAYLDPTVNYTPATISYGNPDLESAMAHSFKLSYMLIKPKFNCNLSVNYGMSNSNISGVNFVDADGMQVSTYDNVGRTRELSIGGFVQWSPTSKTQLMLNGNVGRNWASQQGLKQARWNHTLFLRASQELPWKITLEGFLYSMGKWMNGVYGYSGMSGLGSIGWNLGLRRSFLKDDRLTVSLSASNPIGPSKSHYRNYTINGDVTGMSDTRLSARKSVSLRLSWRFGSLRASVKKTRQRISNDDLVGGSKSGSGQQGGQQGQGM